MPRILPAGEWRQLEAGLKQRVRALNRFIHDVYHAQDIVRAGRIPAEQVFRNSQYRPEMHGVDVPGDIYSHISGVDVVRAGQPASSTCSRTTCACRAACRTCWKTAR